MSRRQVATMGAANGDENGRHHHHDEDIIIDDQDGRRRPTEASRSSPRDPSDDEGDADARHRRGRHHHQRRDPVVDDDGRHHHHHPGTTTSGRGTARRGANNAKNVDGRQRQQDRHAITGGGGGANATRQQQTRPTTTTTSLGRLIDGGRPVESVAAVRGGGNETVASGVTIPSVLLRNTRDVDVDVDGDRAHPLPRPARGGKQRGGAVSFVDDRTTTSATTTSSGLDIDGGGGSGGGTGKRRRPWFASSPGGWTGAATSSSSFGRTAPSPAGVVGHPPPSDDGLFAPPHTLHDPSAIVAGVRYRSATSTKRALEEIRRKKVEGRERRRASAILAALFALALALHFVGGRGRRGGDVGTMTTKTKTTTTGGGNAMDLEYGGGSIRGIDAKDGAAALVPYALPNAPGGDGAAGLGGVAGGGGGEMNDVEDYEYRLPPPVEKTYDPEHEYLSPLRHFSDVSDPNRPDTDTAFFFHVPRSGGSTIKTVLGKCLSLVQASEVGVRDGHGADPVLQVLDVQESRFVNVDTTTVPGIQRAIDLGLVGSGLADVIVSSYFHDSAAMFDLDHQGRAFVVMRDPIDRATSMYYHRVKTLGNLDATTTIEDYAQGNGIENNWMCRYLANRMAGELTKEDLDQAKEVLKTKFLIGFLDDLDESVHQLMAFNGWKYSDDETAKMKQEDCVKELTSGVGGTNANAYEYEIPKRGSQAHALISWQTQFDSKLYAYAKELFDQQTKEWGTKDRKKALKKEKKKKAG